MRELQQGRRATEGKVELVTLFTHVPTHLYLNLHTRSFLNACVTQMQVSWQLSSEKYWLWISILINYDSVDKNWRGTSLQQDGPLQMVYTTRIFTSCRQVTSC